MPDINAAYFNALTAEVNSINACGVLQAFVNEVMAALQAQVNDIENQIAALLPVITIPTDLPSVITWITHFIGPQLAAYEAYAAQLAQTVAAIAALATAIENAAARLESCSIAIPSINGAVVPP